MRFAQRRDNIAGCWPLEAGYIETSNMARKSAHVDEDSRGSEQKSYRSGNRAAHCPHSGSVKTLQNVTVDCDGFGASGLVFYRWNTCASGRESDSPDFAFG